MGHGGAEHELPRRQQYDDSENQRGGQVSDERSGGGGIHDRAGVNGTPGDAAVEMCCDHSGLGGIVEGVTPGPGDIRQ